ncbi:MAG TPA: hypothetical protein VLT62_30715 [Candidatus Methylomirabilis sp.]|nr:hypothetical protein [Candidatus Methylomirabilis sp.]
MRDVSRLRERFLRDDRARRLGNIASNLLRLSHWLPMDRDAAAVVGLLGETAAMIEWAGEDATEELVNIHQELCRWRRIWPVDAARGLLAFRARLMSERVLALSGLTEMTPR